MADFSTVKAGGTPHGAGMTPSDADGGGVAGGSPRSDRENAFVFDWNEVNRKGRLTPKNVTFFDETLRDGLQNPSVKDPSIGEKLEILHLMNDLGIHEADLGLPGSSKRAFDDVLRLCEEVRDCRMKIKVACAGRTVTSDITPMIEIAQRSGVPDGGLRVHRVVARSASTSRSGTCRSSRGAALRRSTSP